MVISGLQTHGAQKSEKLAMMPPELPPTRAASFALCTNFVCHCRDTRPRVSALSGVVPAPDRFTMTPPVIPSVALAEPRNPFSCKREYGSFGSLWSLRMTRFLTLKKGGLKTLPYGVEVRRAGRARCSLDRNGKRNYTNIHEEVVVWNLQNTCLFGIS